MLRFGQNWTESSPNVSGDHFLFFFGDHSFVSYTLCIPSTIITVSHTNWYIVYPVEDLYELDVTNLW